MEKPRRQKISWREKTAYTSNSLKYIFTENYAESLITTFNFSNKNSKELASQLNDLVIGWWQISASMLKHTPNRTNQKALFTHLQKQLNNTLEGIAILRKYGNDTISLLEKINVNPTYDVYPLIKELEIKINGFLERLRGGINMLNPKYPELVQREIDFAKSYKPSENDGFDLHSYTKNLEYLKSQIPAIKRTGNNSSEPFRAIIFHLSLLYEQCTETKPTCYYNEYKENEYSTPFFEFVKAIKEKIEQNFDKQETTYFPKTNTALGEAIKKALKKLRNEQTMIN